MSCNKRKTRLFLHTKDVVALTGLGYKRSLAVLKDIREAFNKPKNTLVSVSEFCEYMNVDEREVLDRLHH